MPERSEAYVWVWLPERTEPVSAGQLVREGRELQFNYGRNYLDREDAIPLYEPELPLRPGSLPPPDGLSMPSCLRDASPDAWGRRVIEYRRGASADEPGELDYLLESGSDRIGALDFQLSGEEYVPRLGAGVPLRELQAVAECVEQGAPLSPALSLALLHGTSIGGARPKALLDGDGKKYIAKFSSTSDGNLQVVRGEFVGMRLAAACGLRVAPVEWMRVEGRDALLVERFDRVATAEGWQRRSMVSALTLFGFDEMMARYCSYEDLAEQVRLRFVEPKAMLRELFGRLCFNILCGNTDDHARNHAAFWDGRRLELTPAYDLCPQRGVGGFASQGMLIMGQVRLSQFACCLDAADRFMLSEDEALALIRAQLETIGAEWPAVCDAAGLEAEDRTRLAHRHFVHPFAFEWLTGGRAGLAALGAEVRAALAE